MRETDEVSSVFNNVLRHEDVWGKKTRQF